MVLFLQCKLLQLILVICGFFTFIYAQNNYSLSVVEGFSTPNTIYATSSNIFVGNANTTIGDQKKKKGFISKLDKIGKIIDLYYITDLEIPRSLIVVNDILYVINVNTLLGFSLSTKKQVLRLTINGATSLSDIAMKDDSTLLLSDSESGLIFAVDLKKRKYYIFLSIETNALGFPNNLVVNDGFLYITTSTTEGSSILRTHLEEKNVEIFHEFDEKLYNIALTKNGGIVIGGKNTQGRVKFYKIVRGGKIYEIDINTELNVFSDFFIDNMVLWIPDSINDRILKIIAE